MFHKLAKKLHKKETQSLLVDDVGGTKHDVLLPFIPSLPFKSLLGIGACLKVARRQIFKSKLKCLLTAIEKVLTMNWRWRLLYLLTITHLVRGRERERERGEGGRKGEKEGGREGGEGRGGGREGEREEGREGACMRGIVICTYIYTHSIYCSN